MNQIPNAKVPTLVTQPLGLAASILVTLLASSSIANAASSGVLDSTFGKANDGTPDGVVNTSLGEGDDFAKAVAIQTNGKIVVAGNHVNGDSSDIAVLRFNANGTLDSTFGKGNDDGTPDGIVNTSLGEGDDFAKAVAIQTNGKIVVAGNHVNGDSSDIAVLRFNANGTLDSTFGKGNEDGTPDGIVNISLGDGDDFANAVAIQADGKIVVAGNHVNGDSSDVAVLRFNTNGTLDSSFGKGNEDGTPDGVVNTSLGDGEDFAKAVAIQKDGKIVVAGNHVNGDSSDIALLRFNKNGTLDSTFGKGNDDGTPDGIVSTSLGNGDDFANAVAVQADGKILITGNHVNGDSSDIAVLRFNTNGTLDSTFGKTNDGTPDGVVNTSLGDGNDFANAVAIQKDGKIVVAGEHENGSSTDIAVLRFSK
jgi:uncharacterized delta-60 repeat protein